MISWMEYFDVFLYQSLHTQVLYLDDRTARLYDLLEMNQGDSDNEITHCDGKVMTGPDTCTRGKKSIRHASLISHQY